MLRRAGPTPEQAERLGKIENASNHLLSIINDILDLSKIEAGRLELEKADFHLGSLLDNVYSLVADQAKAKGLVVEVDPDSVPLWLRGDPTRLRQALLNYAGNAIKFTASGFVAVRARLQTESRRLERLAAILQHVDAFDPEGVLMEDAPPEARACGHGVIAAGLWAARALGANRARVVKHATSGDVSGDHAQVVGYAAALVWKAAARSCAMPAGAKRWKKESMYAAITAARASCFWRAVIGGALVGGSGVAENFLQARRRLPGRASAR